MVCNPGKLIVDTEAQSGTEGAGMEASGKSEQPVAVVTKDAVATTHTGDNIDTERSKRVDCDLVDTTPKASEEDGNTDITAPAKREGNNDTNITAADSKKGNVQPKAVASTEGIDDASSAMIPVGGDGGTSLSALIFVDVPPHNQMLLLFR